MISLMYGFSVLECKARVGLRDSEKQFSKTTIKTVGVCSVCLIAYIHATRVFIKSLPDQLESWRDFPFP